MALNFVIPASQFLLLQEIFDHPHPDGLVDRAVTVHGVLAEVDVADETAVIRHHGYHLRVLTNLLRPFRFRLLSKYRFVGELRRVAAVCPKPGGESCKDGPETVQADDCWLLHARVYQCIDGLDEELWLQGLRLQRRILQMIKVPVLGNPKIGLSPPPPRLSAPPGGPKYEDGSQSAGGGEGGHNGAQQQQQQLRQRPHPQEQYRPPDVQKNPPECWYQSQQVVDGGSSQDVERELAAEDALIQHNPEGPEHADNHLFGDGQ